VHLDPGQEMRSCPATFVIIHPATRNDLILTRKGGEQSMDPKDLTKYLAGLGIAGLLAGTSLMAAEAPKTGGDATKSTPTSTATKTAQDKAKPEPAKSG
jgi:radical SAM modification target selenobiotic family peptide